MADEWEEWNHARNQQRENDRLELGERPAADLDGNDLPSQDSPWDDFKTTIGEDD